MKKLIVLGAGARSAPQAVVGRRLFGAGVAAAAPDVVGKTYADAVSAIEDEGGTASIAVTGSATSWTRWTSASSPTRSDAPFVRDIDGEFGHADSEVHADPELQRRARDGHQSRAPRWPARRAGKPRPPQRKPPRPRKQSSQQVSTPDE